jgi:DNA-directed RNA polymerase alpha subunit
MARTRIPLDLEWEAAERRAGTLASAVAELDLDVRIVNGLEEIGVLYASELVGLTLAELGKVPNFGDQSVERIIRVLGELGLALCASSSPPSATRF